MGRLFVTADCTEVAGQSANPEDDKNVELRWIDADATLSEEKAN